MQREDDTGDVLADVAGMHPALDRLRHLLARAMVLDLQATADRYWTHPADVEGRDRPTGRR